MSIQLVVNGQTYNYPENRDSPGYGEEATSWASAVTGVLSNTVGTGDILQTSATISNNVVSPTNVSGLLFDPTLVRGAIVEYTVYRVTTGGGATEATETRTMYLGFKSTANTWDMAILGGGNAGMTFSITAGGQVQYLSSNFTGSGYSGTMKYRARALTI